MYSARLMSDRGDPDVLGQLYNVSIEVYGCAVEGFSVALEVVYTIRQVATG
jgi:hypothetical protein